MNELPDGFVIRLARNVRIRDNGHTLIGGAPLRVSHLSTTASDLLSGETLTVASPVSQRLAQRLLDSGIAEPVLEKLADVGLAEVTCVVPVRDRATSLDRLLTSIEGLPHVIVVDDCSAEPELIAEVCRQHGAELISLDRNLGPAGARNAGLAAVKTPYVVFVDSDIVITVEAISKLLKHFHDPKVGAAAPRILGLEATGWIGSYEAVRSSLDLGNRSALVRPGSHVSWLPSAVLASRVDALGEGFDESMEVSEDVDLIWRLTDAGWRVRYDADISADHDHRTTFGSWLKRKSFYGQGADLLAARHNLKVAPAVLSPVSAGIVLAALAQRRWSLPVMGLLTAITAMRLAKNLDRSESPTRLGVELAAKSTASSLSQLLALLLRHWWPVAAVGSTFSARIRRAVLVSAIADSVIEYHRLSPKMTPVSFAVARRLDDLAYGTGVWVGAARGKSLRALVPDVRSFSKEQGRQRAPFARQRYLLEPGRTLDTCSLYKCHRQETWNVSIFSTQSMCRVPNCSDRV